MMPFELKKHLSKFKYFLSFKGMFKNMKMAQAQISLISKIHKNVNWKTV